MTSLGAGLSAIGGCTAGLSAVGAVAAIFAREPQAFKLCLQAAGVGIAAMLAGGIITLVGNLLVTGGTVLLAGSAALSAYGTIRLIHGRQSSSSQPLIPDAEACTAAAPRGPIATTGFVNMHPLPIRTHFDSGIQE
jgi:hypothetical protein